MEQHIYIIKKWLNYAVFATPIGIQSHLKLTDRKFVFSGFASRRILDYSGVSPQAEPLSKVLRDNKNTWLPE